MPFPGAIAFPIGPDASDARVRVVVCVGQPYLHSFAADPVICVEQF